MKLAKTIVFCGTLLALAACGQSEQAASEAPIEPQATAPTAPESQIFVNDSVQVWIDATNIYVEANCGDPALDAYMFLHFVGDDGVVTNADFGFDDNAPLVSEGPPARCRATRAIPAGTASVEVGQMVVGGDYIWNVTHEVGS